MARGRTGRVTVAATEATFWVGDTDAPLEEFKPVNEVSGWSPLGYISVDGIASHFEQATEAARSVGETARSFKLTWLDTSLPMMALVFIGEAAQRVAEQIEDGSEWAPGMTPMGLWLWSLSQGECHA